MNSAAMTKFHLKMLKCAVAKIREVINCVRLLSWRASLMKNEDLKTGGILLFLFISPISIINNTILNWFTLHSASWRNRVCFTKTESGFLTGWTRFSVTNVFACAATTVSRCWVAHLGKVCQTAMIYEETEPCLTVCEQVPVMNYRHGCSVDWKCGTASFPRMLKGCSRQPRVTLWDLCMTVFESAARKLAPGLSGRGQLTHILYSRQCVSVCEKNRF